MPPASGLAQPQHDCAICPRLAAYRAANRAANPDWFNGPVPGFGPHGAPLLVVGLAPGVRGANRTGRPFTGDHAGMLLYQSLDQFGFSRGTYRADPQDGLELTGCRIANAVRCVPPGNLPEPKEINACNPFLRSELDHMPALRVILALGVTAHNAVLKAHGMPAARLKFQHGALHALPGGVRLADSYHVSRYNTNTGRLTEAMFHDVMRGIVDVLKQAA